MGKPTYSTLRIKTSNNHAVTHRTAILKQVNQLELHYLGVNMEDGVIELIVDGRELLQVVQLLHTNGNWFV